MSPGRIRPSAMSRWGRHRQASPPSRTKSGAMIPQGADPQEYIAAAASGNGPPQVDGGPPHVTGGMIAELVVTA